MIGIRQMDNKIIFCFILISSNLFSKLETLGSLNFWFFLALNSMPNKTTIKVNARIDNCEAALKLFIPNQRLNIPSVIVSTAKNSTVPKSEMVSIKTSDKPAIIAGLAIGKATYIKPDLPWILATSNKLLGVDRKAALVIKYIYGYKENDKIKLILTDVDGVLTDGGRYFSENGEIFKKFHVRDGMAVNILLRNNIKTIIVTKESSKIVKKWGKEMNVDKIFSNSVKKESKFYKWI